MGSGKRNEKLKLLAKRAPGDQAKERHLRDRNGVLHDWNAPLPRGLVAQPAVRRVKSKHHSYFEFVENKDKKKKLEFQITTDKTPPPGYEFVPIGKPELTTACKELSREKDAMVFIVSDITSGIAPELSLALNRLGHHIRESIVAEARASLGETDAAGQSESNTAHDGGLEPIPESQEEINAQADAAIRDLFPRIPNIDRQQIIERSFRKGAQMGGKPLVGLNPEISLSRRVQLAVIAHIRHEHTRYDQLLRETTYANARKAVVPLCLDYLVKWRGDDETGRDQLDEILREVVVISDTDDEVDDEEEEEDADEDTEDTEPTSTENSDNEPSRSHGVALSPAVGRGRNVSASYSRGLRDPKEVRANVQSTERKHAKTQRRARTRVARGTNMEQRGFQRYRAVRDEAWQQAVDRQRQGQDEVTPRAHPVPVTVSGDAGYVPEFVPEREPGPHTRAHTDHSAIHPRDSGYGAVYVGRSSSSALSPRVDDVHSHGFVVHPATRHRYRETSLREPQTINEPGPIVGPRYGAFGPSSGFQTVGSRPGQDLKDYLVPSIEPASPATQSSSWQPRSDLRYADYHAQDASPHESENLPIFIRRWPPDRRNFSPRPPPATNGHASGITAEYSTGRPVLPGMHAQGPSYLNQPSGERHHHLPLTSTNQDPYVAIAAPVSRREEPFPVAVPRQEYAPRSDFRPRVERRPIGREYRLQYRDADVLSGPSRPIVIDDGDTDEYEASYPIVLGDGPIASGRDHNRHVPIDHGQDSGIIYIRRATPAGRVVHDNRMSPDQADLYPMGTGLRDVPTNATRAFENNIPHPHGVVPSRHDGWETVSGRPRMEYAQEPDIRRYDPHGVQPRQPQEPRTYLPRPERVVRLEDADYEYPDHRRGRPLHERERIYHPRHPASGQPPPDATHQAPSGSLYRKHPRQESVIYIE